VFDDQRKKHGLTQKAIEETIRICKDRNILRNYLESKETEVVTIMMSLFDEEQIMKIYIKDIQKEAKSEGRLEGRLEGKLEAKRDMVIQLLKDNLPIEKVSKYSGLPLTEIEKIQKDLLQTV
jgi:predicted transposase/invertase (TIGR01784 family)